MKRNLRKTISTVVAASLVLSSANVATYADAAKKVSITKTVNCPLCQGHFELV